jgi:predicted lactoylglutathione lyase
MNDGRIVIWAGGGAAMLAVCTPHDEKPASVGNGGMVALAAGSRDGVKKIHARALELGGTDEGEPGPRGAGGVFGYFRDLDGNKLAAFHMGE